MSTREPLGDLASEGQHFRERQRGPCTQELAQASAMNELHGHEDQALRFLHGVEVHDVGMIEGGRSFGFPLKQRQAIDGSGNVAARKLERHSPVESCVLGDVHVSHTAATELRQDE